MKYDFDTHINRRDTDSLKWNVGEDELPLWVADMDFKTAPEILLALKERMEHGVFGYSIIPDYWYDAYCEWWGKRHDLTVKKDWLIFAGGVVPAISSMIRHLTKADEKVLIQPPVYNAFFHIIQDNEREIAENPLMCNNGEYSADFADLEKKLADPKVTMMILCNPHNPIGKIWDRDTLEKIGELCAENGVVVVSDEIHCDLTDPGLDYVPFASVSRQCAYNSITCVAPTKTFNLAGMKSSALIIPDDELRGRVSRGLSIDCLSDPNGFSCDAAYAAYTYGGAWLDQLRQYLFENKAMVKEFLAKELPQVSVTECEATYLMWVNCENVKGFNGESPKFIREKTGLFLSEGRIFGKEGEKCMRMNVACTKETLREALERLKKGIAEVENAACDK